MSSIKGVMSYLLEEFCWGHLDHKPNQTAVKFTFKASNGNQNGFIINNKKNKDKQEIKK